MPDRAKAVAYVIKSRLTDRLDNDTHALLYDPVQYSGDTQRSFLCRYSFRYIDWINKTSFTLGIWSVFCPFLSYPRQQFCCLCWTWYCGTAKVTMVTSLAIKLPPDRWTILLDRTSHRENPESFKFRFRWKSDVQMHKVFTSQFVTHLSGSYRIFVLWNLQIDLTRILRHGIFQFRMTGITQPRLLWYGWLPVVFNAL